MATFEVYDLKKKKVGKIDLTDEMFASEPKEYLLWEVVKWQMAGRRSGTASTKKRGEVSGNNAKMYRQKGTGRARQSAGPDSGRTSGQAGSCPPLARLR